MRIYIFIILIITSVLSSCVGIPISIPEPDCGPGPNKKTYCIDKIFIQ